ncbi:MAG: hypothetical protein WCG08_02975 [Paludibacter sp.]
MALKYCAFWIPTIYHLDNSACIQNNITKDISDNSAQKHHITVNLGANRDIVITNNTGALTLKYKVHSKNGIYLYEYEIDEKSDTSLLFISMEMPNAIYHIIKELYHSHVHHEENADSLLRAFVSDQPIDIRTENNEALVHYLTIYEKKFIAYSDQISTLCNKLISNGNIVTKKHLNLNGYKQIDKLCHNALGEALYCETLLNSKYTNSDNHLIDDSHNQQRIRILNIKNAIQNIKLIEKRNLAEFNYRNTKIAFKNHTQGFIISLLSISLATISIYLTVRSFNTPKYAKEIIETQDTIQNRLDSTNYKIKQLENQIVLTEKNVIQSIKGKKRKKSSE